jgi:hypothetical protein
LEKLKYAAKNLQNVAEERDKFRERMEQMRIEMERVRLAAKKEAEDSARLKSQAMSTRDGEANKVAKLQDEVDCLRDELAAVNKKLEDENQRSREAIESAQSMKIQLETAHKSIAQLKITLAEADRPEDNGDASIIMQEKLDEALTLANVREEELNKLKSELSKNGSVPLKPQSHLNRIGESREEDLNEIAALKKELKKAMMKQTSAFMNNDCSEYTSLSLEVVANRQREENKRLREELERASNQSSLISDSAIVESKSPSEKKLKKELSKLKEANKKILETAEQQYVSLIDLEKMNAELKSEIECLQNASLVGLTADANSSDNLRARLAKAELRLKAEQTRAEEAVARETKLRTEMAEVRNGVERDDFIMHQSIDEEEELDEISTLKFEVERLRSELRVVKDEQGTLHSYIADDTSHKYDELNRIVMQKDLEIERLKLRVRTQDAQLCILVDEVTDDDLMFGMREYSDCSADIAAAENEGLHALNEQLATQLGKYAEELEEAKIKLKEEKTRAEMEIKAFSMALMGVDDLRVAAENMSRQLHVIKKNGYVPPGGLTGEDSSENIQNAMRAVESMARANQSIDHPSMSKGAAVTQHTGFNLWNIMNSVMSPVRESMDDEIEEPIGGIIHGFTANDDDIVSSRKSSSKHKSSKRKKKRSGGSSVISSFF